MKKINLLLMAAFAVAWCLQSCNDGKTYAEMKEEEADAINAWISRNNIKVISESDFYNQDTITHDNEYVLFGESGVYMNIVCVGPEGEAGTRLGDGYHEILSRFVEVAMQTQAGMFNVGDTLLANMNLNGWPDRLIYPEEYKVTISGDSYSASFQSVGSYSMYATYGTSAVPAGWLIPLKYVKPGRTQSAKKVARVRLLVPHGQGTSQASRYVYPCYYELTYNL